MSELMVEIITPKGSQFKKECTSVQFNVADNYKGNYGGSYGVRSGHAKAIFALKKGLVKAFDNNSSVLICECGEGFATVEQNEVRIVVESFVEC